MSRFSSFRPRISATVPVAWRRHNSNWKSRSRAAVSDRLLARLYGSAEADIIQRIDEINPIFATAMPAQEAWRRLRLNHVDAVLVTANDAVWRDRDSWVWVSPPLYASDHVRILAVGGGDS